MTNLEKDKRSFDSKLNVNDIYGKNDITNNIFGGYSLTSFL